MGLSSSLLGTSLESESSEVMLGEGRKERSSRPWILLEVVRGFFFSSFCLTHKLMFLSFICI